MTSFDAAAAALAELHHHLALSYAEDLAAAATVQDKQRVKRLLQRADAAALAALAQSFAVAHRDLPAVMEALETARSALAEARERNESFERILKAIGAVVDIATGIVRMAAPIP